MKSLNSYYKNDIYDTWNKWFNLKKKTIYFSIFTLLKQSFFGYFDFWLKTPRNFKSCSKNGQNHEFTLLSFTFHQKKSTFWRWPFFSELWHGIVQLVGTFSNIFQLLGTFSNKKDLKQLPRPADSNSRCWHVERERGESPLKAAAVLGGKREAVSCCCPCAKTPLEVTKYSWGLKL